MGANLQDHVAFGLVYEVMAADTLHKIASPLLAIWHLIQFFLWRLGLFASMSTKTAIWVRSDVIDDKTMTVRPTRERRRTRSDAKAGQTIPDIELLFVPASFDLKYDPTRAFNSLACIIAQPFSRGSIELRSADPLAMPVVHHPTLTDERDYAIVRKAVRFGMRFVEAFRETEYPFSVAWDSAPGVEPGGLIHDGSWAEPTDEQIDEFARGKIQAIYHPTSSCHMGDEAKGGVVGQDLRVHGFTNLRVGDASVFPRISSSHPMATTLMVAERCADLIRREWEGKKG